LNRPLAVRFPYILVLPVSMSSRFVVLRFFAALAAFFATTPPAVVLADQRPCPQDWKHLSCL
jgi:hypothetical protein